MSNSNIFGSDIALQFGATGILDVYPTAVEVSGLQVLIQSTVMRQTTPTGSLLQAPDDCFDVRGYVSASITKARLVQLQSMISSQLLRDQRINQAKVQCTFTPNTNPNLNTLLVVETIQSSLGPFTLTLSATAVTVSVLVNTTS